MHVITSAGILLGRRLDQRKLCAMWLEGPELLVVCQLFLPLPSSWEPEVGHFHSSEAALGLGHQSPEENRMSFK